MIVKRPLPFSENEFRAAKIKELEERVIGINLLNGHLTDWFNEFQHIFFHLMESVMTIREETSKNIGYFKRISNYLVFIYLDFDLIFFTFDGEVFHEENSGDRCKESRKERL